MTFVAEKPIKELPRFEDDDDDLEMADELSQLEDADEVIKLPNTPFPGDIPITPDPFGDDKE